MEYIVVVVVDADGTFVKLLSSAGSGSGGHESSKWARDCFYRVNSNN